MRCWISSSAGEWVGVSALRSAVSVRRAGDVIVSATVLLSAAAAAEAAQEKVETTKPHNTQRTAAADCWFLAAVL